MPMPMRDADADADDADADDARCRRGRSDADADADAEGRRYRLSHLPTSPPMVADASRCRCHRCTFVRGDHADADPMSPDMMSTVEPFGKPMPIVPPTMP